MNRRLIFALPAALVCLLLAGSTTSQDSDVLRSRLDLAGDHPRGAHTHRVIVQAQGAASQSAPRPRGPAASRPWRRGGRRGHRRTARSAEAQSNLRAHLRRPAGRRRHGGHQQGDRGDERVAGHAAACSVCSARPATPAAGVGVAMLDSGIATHTALDTRVVAHVNLVSRRTGRNRQSVRPRHAYRRASSAATGPPRST